MPPTSPIPTFAQVQDVLDSLVAQPNAHIDDAPHGRFWRVLSHAEFIDPATVVPVIGITPIVVPGDPDKSNLYQILRPPDKRPTDSAVAGFAQMPDGDDIVYATTAQLAIVRDWIANNCPP